MNSPKNHGMAQISPLSSSPFTSSVFLSSIQENSNKIQQVPFVAPEILALKCLSLA